MSLRDNAIVAYAETKVMKKSDRDVWVLGGEILESLLDKTGFEKKEIDALVMSGLTGTGGASMFWAQSTCDMLGLEVGFCEQVHTGGCSAIGAVARAAAAIDAGMCEVALCLFADTHVKEHNGRNDRNYRRDWTEPYGLLGPPGAFGLLQRSYDVKYGVDLRALGKLAVTQRNHAILNENACEELRVPITVEDYLNSRIIADPIRLLDCVMLADGAAGVIVTSRKRAKEKGLNKCVIPIGYAERTNFLGGENLVDVTRSGHEIAGKKALAAAGLNIKDVLLVPPPTTTSLSPSFASSSRRSASASRARAWRSSATPNLSYKGTLRDEHRRRTRSRPAKRLARRYNLIEAVRQLMWRRRPTPEIKDTANALVTGIGWINYGRNWGSSAARLLVPNQ